MEHRIGINWKQTSHGMLSSRDNLGWALERSGGLSCRSCGFWWFVSVHFYLGVYKDTFSSSFKLNVFQQFLVFILVSLLSCGDSELSRNYHCHCHCHCSRIIFLNDVRSCYFSKILKWLSILLKVKVKVFTVAHEDQCLRSHSRLWSRLTFSSLFPRL